MKVICIDAKNREDDYDNRENVIEGECYTVTRTLIGYGTSGEQCECHELEEIKPDYLGPVIFDVDRFIPLSDIDEMELVNENSSFA